MSAAKSLTWLVTGSSSGFGLTLSRTILAHGHNVIATSRKPSRTPEYVKEIESTPRGKWLTLDVAADATTINSTIEEAKSVFGTIDVLINNAGYSVFGTAEDIPEDKAKQEFEVNFWGAIRVAKAVLPIMRAQRSGTIVNMSSIAGIHAAPSVSIYSASKFALEAWSESLCQEVGPLGLRVLIIEPGAFRTNFLGADAMQSIPASEDYKDGPADMMLRNYSQREGKQPGNPEKGCERIVCNIEKGLKKDELGKIEHLRLPLGQDCYDRILAKMDALHQNWKNTKDEALGVEFEGE